VRRVRERDELADRIDASCYTPLDPGLFSVHLETDAARAAGAIEAVVREVERVRAEPAKGEELEKARANFLAAQHFERESVTGQAIKLGSFQLTAGDYRAEERYLEAVRAATPADLLRVARAWLGPEQLNCGVLLPEAEAGALGAAGIAAAVRRGVERTARALARPPARPGAPELARYELPGGARLFAVPRRSLPVVAARAAFRGGLLAEDEASVGLSSFLASMWLRGTRSHSAAGFARSAESLAAEIDSFAGRSSLGLTLECPSDRLEPALDLLSEVILEPAFDPEELEHERRETLAAIERREDNLAGRVFLLFAEAHYRRHPYRHPLLGTRESVAGFSADRVQAHHERLVRAGNLVVAVAGDVDPDEVAQRVSSRLAELDPSPRPEPAAPVEEAPREIRRATLAKEREQVHLVIGFRGVDVQDPDRFALAVMAQILAGQGGRLFLDLRDRQGLAYSVSAHSVEALAPGYFATYIATAPEKLAHARAGLLRELERMRAEPPGEDELERARRYLVGNFAIELQRNASHAAHVCLDALYGLGPDAYHRTPARVAAVSAADVQRVARRILDLGAYTEALVGPASTL
jgi:zinc protease